MTADNKEPVINSVTNLPEVTPEESDAPPSTETPADTPTPETVEASKAPDAPSGVPEVAPYTAPDDVKLPEPDPNLLATAERAELEQLRASQAEVTRQTTQNQEIVAVQQFQNEKYQQLIAKGVDEFSARERAAELAEVRLMGQRETQAAQNTARDQQAYNERKQKFAQDLGKEYGVDPNALMLTHIRDEDAMRDKALSIKSYRELEKRVGKTEEATVDDGTPDGGQPSGSTPMTGTQLLAYSGANPDWVASVDQQKLIDAEMTKIIG